MLEDPRASPYGTPIPGQAELGGPAVERDGFRVGVVTLPEAVTLGQGGQLVIRRLGEPVQTDTGLMAQLARVGLRPGSGVSASRIGNTLRVRSDSESIDLPLAVALHVFVSPVAQGDLTVSDGARGESTRHAAP